MYACITFVMCQQHAYNWHIVDVLERETALLQGDAYVFDCLWTALELVNVGILAETQLL